MKKTALYRLFYGTVISLVLIACGEDRSGEYYALIASKTWIYETMQQNYLFYEDIPAEKDLDFFQTPENFLKNAASSKDQKNGTLFSHIDSVNTSRTLSDSPTFGYEAALIRTGSGDYAIRVLYTQPNSPAEEAGLKRGDWIIAANNKKIGSGDYSKYVSAPTQSFTFTLGNYNGEGFDTLGTTQIPAPRYIEETHLMKTSFFTVGNRTAAYILYNSFGLEDTAALQAMFSEIASRQPNDIILDLRYNPGGYVSTSQLLSTLLAPQNAIGQTFLNMTYNDKIAKTDTYLFDASLIPGGTPLTYDNLYVLTSNNTASASEIVINCLRPYLKERLLQVGTATFGKNVAQSLFTDEQSPQLELWLTTAYLSNAEGFQDYFTNGLQPDYELAENYAGTLGELGTAEDELLIPVLTRMTTGSFPAGENTAAEATRSTRNTQVLHCSVNDKSKQARNNFR